MGKPDDTEIETVEEHRHDCGCDSGFDDEPTTARSWVIYAVATIGVLICLGILWYLHNH